MIMMYLSENFVKTSVRRTLPWPLAGHFHKYTTAQKRQFGQRLRMSMAMNFNQMDGFFFSPDGYVKLLWTLYLFAFESEQNTVFGHSSAQDKMHSLFILRSITLLHPSGGHKFQMNVLVGGINYDRNFFNLCLTSKREWETNTGRRKINPNERES